jgi:hypothetical protein
MKIAYLYVNALASNTSLLFLEINISKQHKSVNSNILKEKNFINVWDRKVRN